MPRIMKLAKLGLIPFTIGDKSVKSDWVYVDNIVLALLLASMGLLDDIPGRVGLPVASGQSYFISDGKFGPYYLCILLRNMKSTLIVALYKSFDNKLKSSRSSLNALCFILE